jgi:predicted aldo/keto reductase-like oxidoreductase
MLYRTMKKTGDRLSVLGFGCMRVPQKRGRIDEARATRQIRFAIDQGVNYVDTAMLYHMGANEPFLGRALGDGYREKVKLATKPLLSAIKTRQDMDRVLKAQLAMLKTDYIDYYLFHGLNGQVWKKMRKLGGRDFLDRAKGDGRIRFAGFSFHGDLEAFKEIVDDYDWDACVIQYNYLDENNQAGTEGLKYAAEKGLGVVVMEPLRGGNLAGRIPPAVQAIWDEAEVKRSPAEWALRWLWNHLEVTVVLSGMNREDHIRENLRIADEGHPNSLSERELELVRRVAETYRGLMKAGCTGCRYCMPCPSGWISPRVLKSTTEPTFLVTDRSQGSCICSDTVDWGISENPAWLRGVWSAGNVKRSARKGCLFLRCSRMWPGISKVEEPRPSSGF